MSVLTELGVGAGLLLLGALVSVIGYLLARLIRQLDDSIGELRTDTRALTARLTRVENRMTGRSTG